MAMGIEMVIEDQPGRRRWSMNRLLLSEFPGMPFAANHSFTLAALASDQWNHQFQQPFWLTHLTGYDTDASGFQVQLVHYMPAGPRRVFKKFAPNGLVLGMGSNGKWPLRLPEPYLIDAGESVTVEVKNLSQAANAATVWVGLLGKRVVEL